MFHGTTNATSHMLGVNWFT